MLVVKTGMAPEFAVVKKFAAPEVMVISGTWTADKLDAEIPKACTGIISMGVCGGLVPGIKVGEAVLSAMIHTPDCSYKPDQDWLNRLYYASGAPGVSWWSSGEWNTANNAEQRHALFVKTGCAVIDDETYAVVTFAKKRGINAMAARTISDAATDNLPPAVLDAISSDGTTDIGAVIRSVVTDPFQIPSLLRTAWHFEESIAGLAEFCKKVGGNFQWFD